MRNLVFIFLLFSANCFATNYFVKATGSDGNAGTSTGAAWQTISKLSAYSLSPGFLPGDTIFLNRGDVWIDSLGFYSSGTLGNAIVITAYGTGAKPEITGFRSLTMTSEGGNLWTGTATYTSPKQNTVLLNGSLGIKARIPNADVYTYTTATTSYLLIPHTTTDYTGKELAINTATWDISATKVASHHTGATNDTLYYLYPTFYGSGKGGTGYFFQNDASYCDTTNEWALDSTTKLLTVYSTTTPTVSYSLIDTILRVIGKNYISFQNIVFSGANKITAYVVSAKGITFDGCEIKNASEGVYAQYTSGLSYTNGRIENSLNSGVASFTDTSLNITGNTIDRIGIYAGMGKSMLEGAYYGQMGYAGISNYGNYFNFSNNSITNIGHNGIRFFGQFGVVQNNYIKDFGISKSDCGGVVTGLGSLTNQDSGSVVKKNIIYNTTSIPKGVTTSPIRVGVYLDQGTQYVTVDSNTIIQTDYGIYAKGNGNVHRYNTLYDTTATVVSSYLGAREGTTSFHTFTNNTVVNKGTAVLQTGSVADTLLQIFDNNRYFYYSNPSGLIYKLGVASYTIANFKASAPTYDVHSTYNALPTNSFNEMPTIIYNNSLQDLTIVREGDWVDPEGNFYHRAIPLKSFTSKILFRSTLQIRRQRVLETSSFIFY